MPVTQLYVSIDASTKDSLKKIDRPLFRDFWPRFINSLEALSEKVSSTEMEPCHLTYLLNAGFESSGKMHDPWISSLKYCIL